jgi:hypothetical protein
VTGERIGQGANSTYQLRLLGEVSQEDVNRMSPCRVSQVRRDEKTTTFRAVTDQAGMIGLMRYLHGMGFVILSAISEVKDTF